VNAAVRAKTLSARAFLRVSVASLVALFVVVTSGAFVRLTGSGLGCENWPRCGDKPYPEQGFHAFVEFGNRVVALVGIVLSLVTWLAARRVDGLSRLGRLAALMAFLVAFAQIPMGGITVILELHPLAVMTHFLLGMAVVAAALVAVIEGWGLLRGFAAPAGARRLRQVVTWLGLPAAATLVVTGAVATASGPHPGASKDVERLGLGIADTVYVHVRVAAAFGIGVLVVGWFLSKLRRGYPGVVATWTALLVVLVAQAVLGEVQYRRALPWGLVLFHVFLAAAVWALSVGLAHVLWRPPRPLARGQ
jgi:cytochrome c oxidase assembly protein subunit 15